MGIRGLVKKTVKTVSKDAMKARSAVRGAAIGGVSKVGSGAKSQTKKAFKGIGKQIPGYGEFGMTNSGSPKTNRAGNAVRKMKGK